MMTTAEARRAIKAARKVFAWTKLYGTDGEYLQVQKQSLLAAIDRGDAIEFDLDLRHSDLYIN